MDNKQSSAGGGAIIALGAISGSVGGLYAGQPSLGLLLGLGVGSAIAILIWLRTR